MITTCRPLDILFTLYTYPPMTLNELTEKYNVTERTIYRDIKTIREVLKNYQNERLEVSLEFNDNNKRYTLLLNTASELTLSEIIGIV